MQPSDSKIGYRTVLVSTVLAEEWLCCKGNYSGQRQLSSNAPSDMRIVRARTPDDQPWFIEFICCSVQWEPEIEGAPYPEFDLVMTLKG